MSDANDNDGGQGGPGSGTPGGAGPGGRAPLTLKPRAPGVNTGVVRQSFSHGRSKTVVVETKRRREGDRPPVEVRRPAPPVVAAPRAEAPAAPRPATPTTPPAGGPALTRMTGVPGDHADGFASEYVAMAAGAFTRLPVGWSFEEAATLPCAALTAWRALVVEARIKPGDVVLTQGTGGVSIFAVQLAKAAGLTVIGTAGTEVGTQDLKDQGVDFVFNHRDKAYMDQIKAQFPGGVDIVIEMLANVNLSADMEILRVKRGRVVVVGNRGNIEVYEFNLQNTIF